MKKVKLVVSIFLSLFFIFIFFITAYASYYVYGIINNAEEVTFENPTTMSATYIYDSHQNQVKVMNELHKRVVTYEEMSDHFINALVSIEDQNFFVHDGLDYGRLLMSLYQNIANSRIVSGGSTLTQQLVKNTIDDDSQTLERKIREAYLAMELENKYDKKEIFTLYANQILFDGMNNGVNTASLRYFHKDISEVTLPEAALLAAQVKSPTLYNPITHPENAQERKNLVLEMMYSNNYITLAEKEAAQATTIEEILYKPSTAEETYPYQAYLDIVYEQVEEITGLDPFYTPMKIETYLDSELQLHLDRIQKGEDPNIVYLDERQQIAGAVIDNQSGAIVGVIGGRDYHGEKLFNRAYHMKQQPASTMKPILSYALALEYLDWSDIHVVEDAPMMYPKTNVEVHNVDGRYLGQIYLEEALGYSRNTAAVKTLESVVQKIGMRQVAEYLNEIGLLDVSMDLVNYAYGLGGMYEGVSPIQLASAYRILASKGVYITPTTIKKIELLDGSNQVFYPEIENKQVLSEETTFLMTHLLTSIVNKNYWGIGYTKVADVAVASKTGTSNFDEKQARMLGYPINANKDIWYAGYTPDYSFSVWTGFDKALANENTYFYASKDARVTLARAVYRRMIDLQAKRNLTFEEPTSLTQIDVVKGTYPYLLGDSYTPTNMLITGYFTNDNEPSQRISMPTLPKMKEPQIFMTSQELEINFLDQPMNEEKPVGKVIFDYTYIYGPKTYFIDIYLNGEKVDSLQTSDRQVIYPIVMEGEFVIKIYYRYLKDKKVSTPDYQFSFYNGNPIELF